MSDALSTQIFARLRSEADQSSRPKERHGTLDRLFEACNDISSGKARAIVKEGFSDAEVNFRRSPTLIKSARIEEYVFARRAIDAKAKRVPSQWTGPVSTTIRKDTDLREYVQVRQQEQTAAVVGKVSESSDKLLDKIGDLALASEIRFVLSKARQTENDFKRLKAGMRMLRPTFDIDGLINGLTRPENFTEQVPAELPALPAPQPFDAKTLKVFTTAVLKLTDGKFLSKFGLELNLDYGNLVERKTRFELFSSEELAALKALAGLR